jgi:tetratricopeptide (TPR) repeat protein
VNSNADIQKALEPVLLYRVDAEKGAGKDLAKEFKIKAYPTFIIVNKNGEAIDLWLGYEKNIFIKTLASAQLDLSTIAEKKTRYQTKPDLGSAITLGRYSSSMGDYKDAVDYYRTAHVLTSNSGDDYSYDIFENTAEGARKNLFTYDDVILAADAVMAQPHIDANTVVQVSDQMIGLAKANNKPADVAKYIQAGLDATATSDSSDIKKMHAVLMVEYALSVKHDTVAAVENKKATMSDNWQQNAGDLNEFAWWCFENKTNLVEAEKLSRESIKLAKPGREKANCYDTLAEIVFARGNAKEALEMSQKSVAEDSTSKYFPTQVERFQKEVK